MKNNFAFLILILLLPQIMLAQINSGTPAIQFGTNKGYAHGIMPTNLPSIGIFGASQKAADAYNTWKTNYVATCTNGYRVKWDNTAQTVSEGIAYGMLLSAYAGDKDLFDGLWQYYKANSNINGVMNWLIEGCSTVKGANGATDAELDAAMALIVAEKQWPTATSPYDYKTEATFLISKIKEFEINPTTYQTVNGDGWGLQSTCRNPSYLSPAYYRQFAILDATNAAFWNNAIIASDAMLLGNRNATTGLVSNWSTNTSPYSDNNCNSTGSGFGSDACRNPWRMAVDVIWNGSTVATTAYDITSKLTNWISGYEDQLKGPLAQDAANPGVGSWKIGTYSPFGLAPMAIISAQTNLDKCYTNIADLKDDDGYFNTTLRVVSLFVLTGNFWDPNNIVQTGTSEIQQFGFQVYPNPCENHIKITAYETMGAITITNISGTELKNIISGSSEETIDISQLASGVYFVKVVFASGNVQTVKFMKK